MNPSSAEANRAWVRNRIQSRDLTETIEAFARTLVEVRNMGSNWKTRLTAELHAEEFDRDHLGQGEWVDDFSDYEVVAEYVEYIVDFSDDELGDYDPDSSVPETWAESDANPEG